MYIPKLYKLTDASEIENFVKSNGFAVLVSNVEGRPFAVHIPLVLAQKEGGTQVLRGHVARGNSIWRAFEQSNELLAIFQGPHAYISSSWYEAENVSTWNYEVVHIYGKPRILSGDELEAALRELTDMYEQGRPQARNYDSLSRELIDDHIPGLVAFEIAITEIQAAKKMSQSRKDSDYQHIIHQLEKSGRPEDLATAEEMKRLR